MQYVDCIVQSGGIDDSIDSEVVTQANLFHAFSDAGHGFEAAELIAALHLALTDIPHRVWRLLKIRAIVPVNRPETALASSINYTGLDIKREGKLRSGQ
jgi:hypothetical protein